MRVLLTGHRGYLGHALQLQAPLQVQLEFLPVRLLALRAGSLDPELVIHTAGALRHRKDCWESNVEGTAQLLKALKKPVPVVFCSSRSVYAASEKPGKQKLRETDLLGPQELYGRSKWAAEKLIQESDCPVLSLRLTNCVGWNGEQAGRSFWAQVAYLWAQGQTVTRYTPDAQRDELYVQDAARRIWALSLAEKPAWGKIYNLAAQARGVHQILGTLADAFLQLGCPALMQDKTGPAARSPLMSTKALENDYPELPELSSDAYWCHELAELLLKASNK